MAYIKAKLQAAGYTVSEQTCTYTITVTVTVTGSATHTIGFSLVVGNGNPDPGGTWTPGTTYRAGDLVTYNGITYRCVQRHTAQVGWEPPIVPALWEPV
ncbi:carbohydrate-binding protein [Kitasatospora sp. NPDC018058]|uniref:carbohydrate-binding protein n=1 Tax=Kitasatospora sp. NPDC018058 TaxID=3364025 RepID=UPI0037BEF266